MRPSAPCAGLNVACPNPNAARRNQIVFSPVLRKDKELP